MATIVTIDSSIPDDEFQRLLKLYKILGYDVSILHHGIEVSRILNSPVEPVPVALAAPVVTHKPEKADTTGKTISKHTKSAPVKVKPKVDSKQCTNCKVHKLAKDFYTHCSSEDNLQSWCIDCSKHYSSNRHKVNQSLQQAAPMHTPVPAKPSRPTPSHQVCITCKQLKTAGEFGGHNMAKNGLQTRCRKCNSDIRKKHFNQFGI